MIGTRFGRYRVEEELGRGDFGVTWRAVDVQGGGPELALKVAHAHLRQDDHFMGVLERECVPLRELRHPGIAYFHGLLSESGQLAAARELVLGEDVRRVLTRGRISVEHVPGLLELALRALAHAQTQHLIHGDLSPSNLFWCYDGTLRITDFGLARSVHMATANRTNAPPGHPDYMAPELVDGQISGRSDLYALGLIAYECLVGRSACEPGDLSSKLSWHRYKGMPDPRIERPDCPDWLARLLLQLAAIDPATRPRDAQTALGLLRPVTAPSLSGSGEDSSTHVSTVTSGLEPPPPPERTPPTPPRLERPVPEDTIPAVMSGGFGAGQAEGQGFGFGHLKTDAGQRPPDLDQTSAALPPPVAAQPTNSGPPPSIEAPRVPVSASARGVDRRIDPISQEQRELEAKRERLRVAVFWSVAVGVLLVSVVAFVGYRAVQARRLAAARASGPDIDPELIVGGGYDRFGETPVEASHSRGPSSGPANPAAGEVGAGGGSGSQTGSTGQEANERYLLGGDEQPVNEYAGFSITSNPIGARVWLDNDEIGHTPIEGFSVREGRHTIRLELDGYAWASRRLDVARGVDEDLGVVTLEREVVAAGPVLLWSVELEGASVFVDDSHAGHLPVVVDMTPGQHTFFVQPSQGEPVELELTAYPGTEQEPGRLQLEPPH